MTILFYPDPLNQNCKIHQHLLQLEISFHNDIYKPYDIFIYWSYHKAKAELDEFTRTHKGLNKGCDDISKTRINDFFDNINVNPETYEGLVVRKTEGQCSLDETVMQCPTPKQDGYVYRKYIETKVDGMFVDYRLFYFGGIKFICIKRNPGPMFSRQSYTWHPMEIDCIPKAKRDEIEDKCKAFGFDIGEVDVLKDVNTGLFYVIDINNVSGLAFWNAYQYGWMRMLFTEAMDNYFKEIL